MSSPTCILLFTGKRKSGKDYVTDLLHSKLLGPDIKLSPIIRLSAPIKLHWARTHSLDYDLLLSDGPYKELHRKGMVEWGVQMRNEDPGYFCRAAIEMSNASPGAVWIVSDSRYRSDLKWFGEAYPGKVKTVRVVADDEVRKNRGWVWTDGIDDVPSECDLDGHQGWNFVVKNEGTEEELKKALQPIVEWVREMAKK